MTTTGLAAPPSPRVRTASPRPQSLMLTFLGVHVLDSEVAVSTGSVIDVLARVGVSEEAVRSTLARMVKRGLLVRHRAGRQVHVGLTPRASAVLRDGHDRIWRTGVVNRDWDGTWTVVSFSLPDSRRRDRHELRSRLVWEGFGPLQSGQWISSGTRDVTGMVEDLGLAGHVHVLVARSAAPTTDHDLVPGAFDLVALATRYRAFIERWGMPSPLPDLDDDLARQLLLHTDWLQLVRQDPHLPEALLPADWPGTRSDEIFHELAARYAPAAAAMAREVIDTVPLPEG